MSANGPSIPTTEFTPRPDGQSAQWGVSVRRVGDPRTVLLEVWEPEDVFIAGAPMPWYSAGDDSGVLYAKVNTVWGMTVAIARAVPLS